MNARRDNRFGIGISNRVVQPALFFPKPLPQSPHAGPGEADHRTAISLLNTQFSTQSAAYEMAGAAHRLRWRLRHLNIRAHIEQPGGQDF